MTEDMSKEDMDMIEKEPESRVVPQSPKKKEATDKDPTGTPSLNEPNRAKRTPAPEDNEA
jgi:hypothetical protein